MKNLSISGKVARLYPFFLLLFCFACAPSEPVEINFGFGPDDSGATAELIEKFNNEHKGKIKVDWTVTSRASNEFFHTLIEDFESNGGQFDVFGSDVIWTATFAKHGWVEDLSSQFYSHYQPEDFIQAALNSTAYNQKIYGVPSYTDIGLLFYRKDLLKKAGYYQAPKTWKELSEMSKKIIGHDGIEYGYVFQGAQYEGGTANACEFIWNAGGNILLENISAGDEFGDLENDPNLITVDSDKAIEGMNEAYHLVKNGVSPEQVYMYLEDESLDAFRSGKALFMRNWPGIYSAFSSPNSAVDAAKVGVAALPVSRVGNRSYSCLGGWNLMINAQTSSEKKQAAWEFIKYMTDSKQQKYRAMKGANLPSLRSLYADKDILKSNPIAGLMGDLIKNARSRPITPYYREISPKISKAYNKVLRGEKDADDALNDLVLDLSGILIAHN